MLILNLSAHCSPRPVPSLTRRDLLRMAAATAAFAPASATAPLLHHHRCRFRHNYSCGLAIARPSSSCGGVRRRPILPSCGYGRAPLVPASDHWGNWTFLLSAAALGIWSEKRTPTGKALTGALVSALLGLAASSAGVVAADDPAYRVALDYLLPLAIPLLLFRADLHRRRVFRSAGALLLAFLLGSVATAMGTVVAFQLVPMRSLGPDNWKIAVALMSRHIGGAFSFVAVCEALGVSPSVVPAGLAAGNAMSALYFTGLFALAAKIPAEESQSAGEEGEGSEPLAGDNTLPDGQSAMAVAAAFAICRAGKLATSMLGQLGIPGASLPYTTAAVVMALATFFPSQIAKLAPSDALAAIVMQVLFVVVGVNASIGNAITTAPSILAFAFVQIAAHLLVTLGMGKLLGFDRKLLLVASAANVSDLTTACGMAVAKGWTSLLAPGILAGIFGIAITTFMGVVLGRLFLSYLVISFFNPIVMAMAVGMGFGSLALKTFVGIGSDVLALKFINSSK